MAASFESLRRTGVAVMNEQAHVMQNAPQVGVEERRDTPGVWTVEAIGGDGEIYQALFVGPEAEGRAKEYAGFKYGQTAQ